MRIDARARSRPTRARCRPTRRPRPTSTAPTTRPAPRSASSSTRSTSAAAGSRRSTSRRACPGFRTVEAGLRARGPWTATSCRLTRDEIAHTFGQDPEHVLMGHFERHLNELGEQSTARSLAFARGARRRRGARDRARVLADLVRRLPLPERRRPVLQARPDRRRRPRARGLTTPRPRPPDAVRRQPRPPRAAHRRRPRPSTTTSSPASTPASCSSTTPQKRSRSAPSRCTPSSCWSRRTRTRRPPPPRQRALDTAAPHRATRPSPATAPARPPTERCVEHSTAKIVRRRPRFDIIWVVAYRGRGNACALPRAN